MIKKCPSFFAMRWMSKPWPMRMGGSAGLRGQPLSPIGRRTTTYY